MIDYQAINEAKVEEYAKRVYPDGMSAHSKKVLREMLEAEDRFYLKEAAREDSNSPVGDWWGAREVSD